MDQDPNLIPTDQQPRVPALQALTRPLGSDKAPDTVVYKCTVPNASTHRRDGKKLAFVHGILKTNIVQDIQHMTQEIEAGNDYFRLATPQEVEEYDMRTDPKGTLTRNIKAELEPEIRARVEGELRAELEAKIRAEMAGMIAAQDGAKKLASVDKAPGSSSIRERIETAQGATLVHKDAGSGHKPPITPVSTADVAGAAQQSGK